MMIISEFYIKYAGIFIYLDKYFHYKSFLLHELNAYFCIIRNKDSIWQRRKRKIRNR